METYNGPDRRHERPSNVKGIGDGIKRVFKYVTVATTLAMGSCIGAVVAHDYPQAAKVSDVKDEFDGLKSEFESDVVLAAQNVRGNPHALAKVLQETSVKFESFIDNVEILQKDGLKIRADLVEKMVVTVEEGRGKTWNEDLVFAAEIRDFSKILGSFTGASKYVPVKNQLDAINKQLNRLRKILLRMEDIDLTGVTNNVDVNLHTLFTASDLQDFDTRDEILDGIEIRKERRQEYREAMNFLKFRKNKKGKSEVIWDGRYSSSDVERLQTFLFLVGFLEKGSQITGNEDVATKNAFISFVGSCRYQKNMLKGAYDPDKVAEKDKNARLTQLELVYMGYLDKKYVDSEYHERTHQRLEKYYADFRADKEMEKTDE